jgi:hypothetical protein
MKRDDNLHPWLSGLDESELAQLAVDLTYAICRPSFGSLSKRELEQTLFRLLYEHRREQWRALGDIANDLAITRSKARSLVLEYRARAAGELGPAERGRLLSAEVLSWPQRNVDQTADRLRIVVDDPFLRDLLKNFAYARGILLDQSFSSEILVFGWDAYGQLLAGVYEDRGGVSDEDLQTIAAGMRAQIVHGEAVKRLGQAELDKRLAKIDEDIDALFKSKAARRAEKVAEFGKTWGPAIGGALLA